MSKSTLTVTDNRTGKTYEIPIHNETIKAIEQKIMRPRQVYQGQPRRDYVPIEER